MRANAGFQEIDWYDLPRYYDLVFAEDTEREAAFLEAVSSRYGATRGKKVLEPACGSGRLLEAMGRRGYRVAGFDRNPRMLRYARERMKRAALPVTLRRLELDDFGYAPGFDLAYCLVSTFKYLLDERSARQHLECVAASLKPGGLYVLGLHLSEYGTTSRTRERWVAKRGTTRVVCNIQIWPPVVRSRRERVRSRLVVRERTGERRFETNWPFRTYDAGQVRDLLRSVPTLRHVATFDFTYRIDRERQLDDRQLDVVLILQRAADG